MPRRKTLLGQPAGWAIKSSKIWETVGRVYDDVEIALWATLFAFVIYFIAFIIPKLPEVRAQTERVRVQEIAAENAFYCQKLGMKVGTDKHKQCLLDLEEFRLKVENESTMRVSFSNSAVSRLPSKQIAEMTLDGKHL